MPNTYEATDPKTGQKWTWDGKTWNPVKEGAVSRFEKGLRTSMGFQPEGGVKEDVSQIGSGLEHIFTHPIDSAKLLAQGLFGSQQGLAEQGVKEMHDPNLLTKATGVGHWAESGIPMIGPALASSGEKFGSGDVAGGFGSMAPFLVPPLAERGLPAVSEAAGKLGKSGVRDVLGVGEKDVEGHIKKAATKEETAHQAALAKVEKAKENYAGAVADAIKKRAQASAKETAAKTKQEALTSKHGPVYQRMNEMADQVQQHIGDIEQKVNETESKKWEAFKDKVGNPPVETQGVVDAITDVRKNILTGDSVPVFNQILAETLKDEGGAEEFIDRAGGLVPKSGEIPLDLARRLYTKLSRKLNGSELPKDVARAMSKVQDSLDSSIAQGILQSGSRVSGVPVEIAKVLPRDWEYIGRSSLGITELKQKGSNISVSVLDKDLSAQAIKSKIEAKLKEFGKPVPKDYPLHDPGTYEQSGKAASALREYRKLQADWRQYRETFSDRTSPLRKIAEAKDPSTKLGPITGETGARAIDYLGRYRDLGAQPELLGRIRALHKALKELPGGGGKVPAMPERTGLPEVPATKTITPQAARESMLESKGQFFSRPPSKWEIMFPPLLAYKQTLKHLMQSEGFRKWLSKE